MSERKLLFLMNAAQAEAFARLVAAARHGDGAAACRLGDMYREGLAGLRYSPKKTFHWYSRSALAGDANGQNNLGACYEHGLGCTESYTRAVKWYGKAAAQRLGTASMNLGYCYLNGHGVPRDRDKALRLFREAVELGENRAAREVEQLEREAGSRVSEPVPAGTPSTPQRFGVVPRCGPAPPSLAWRSSQATRPWGLARRVPLRDGPPEQLQHPETADDLSDAERLPDTLGTTRGEGQTDSSEVRLRPRIRFVDETQPDKLFGLVGAGGVQPAEDGIPEEERVRRELLEVLKVGEGDAAASFEEFVEATDDELFPIYAECGMQPDDFVESTARKYAAFLRTRERGSGG